VIFRGEEGGGVMAMTDEERDQHVNMQVE